MSQISRSLLLCGVAALASVVAADVEKFNQASPFDWSATKYPRTILNSHTMSRTTIASGTTCVPSAGGYPIEWLGDREGGFTGGSTVDCEAWAFRKEGPKHVRGDSRMTAYIDHTEMMGNPQKAGLVARAKLEWSGGQGWVFSPGEGGYAAVVRYLPADANGYPTTVTIFRLKGDCLSDAGVIRVSPTFYTVCEDQHFLTFDVFESGPSTVLQATLSKLSAADPAVHNPIAISADPLPADPYTLWATDSSVTRPRAGHNGVVGYAVGADAVFVEDVSLSDLTTASFDGLAAGTTIGSASGATPGTEWFDVPADLDSNGEVDITDLATLLVDRYQRPNGTFAFGNATIQPAGPNFGLGMICAVDLADLAIRIKLPTKLVTIDYQYSGAPTNLQVNGAPLFVGSLSDAPQNIAPGIVASTTQTQVGPIIRGRLTIASNNFDIDPFSLDSVRIGGEHISIDNIRIASDTQVVECLADFDDDGTVDFFDYDAFVTCFEGGACPPGKTADFDGDGSVDFFDYDAFVVAFETPC